MCAITDDFGHPPCANFQSGTVARQIWSLSKEHSLLPAQHKGACPGKSIDTPLNFPVQQIHASWQNKDCVTMLLLLDMTGDFVRFEPAWLLHNMGKRKYPELIVEWVSSFISNRTTDYAYQAITLMLFPHTRVSPKAEYYYLSSSSSARPTLLTP